MKMWPFFCFYGGKWRAAPRYPAPKFKTIIEPFSGAAGYSTRHFERDVILLDINPVIQSLWRYLINVSSSEIRSLPIAVEHVDKLSVCTEARHLIGFWLNKATSCSPRKQPSAWMRSGIRPNSYWGEAVRERIANQVEHIRHWKVLDGGYQSSPELEASWFIDPPYANAAGAMYRHQVDDYGTLGEWCRQRKGQLIVCENDGASWLPFEPLGTFKSNPGKRGKAKSQEVMYSPNCAAN